MGNIAKGSIEYTPQSSDDVTVKVNFAGDAYYKASEISKIIHAKHRTSLKIITPTSEVYTNEDYTIQFELTDNESTLNGTYTLVTTVNDVNNNVTLTTDTNHVAKGELTVNAGTTLNNISATFNETDDYLSTNMTATVTPTLRLITLTVTPSTTEPILNDTVTFNVVVKDSNNALVNNSSNYKIRYYQTNDTETVNTVPLTVNNNIGSAQITQKFTTTGTSTWRFQFIDKSKVFDSQETDVSIKTLTIPTTLTITGNETTTINTPETVHITLKDTKNSISEAEIQLTRSISNGSDHSYIAQDAQTITLTGSNGILTYDYTYTPSSTQPSRIYATYNGNDTYSSSESTFTTHAQHTTNLTITPSTESPVVGEAMTFDIQLSDPENTLTGEQTVTVNINGTEQTVTLNTE